MPPQTLAIDFGTSNSAAAILDAGRPRRLAIEAGSDTVPTAVFFPADRGAMRIGAVATGALIAGEEGRYMRALKSVLGTALFHDPRLIGGKRRTLADIVTAFLTEVRTRAETAAGVRFSHALSGRPVHFHSSDPERDAKAQSDLRGCYLAAGFQTVDFMFEPEAAALASHGLGKPGELGLIVDIGGGTSDYSVFQSQGDRVRILASHGIRLGGTDFDHAISVAHVMPLLGLGGELRREIGPGLLPVPKGLFLDLATWAKIPFLYTRETQSAIAEMVKRAVDPQGLQRFATVLRDELGHDLAFAVEGGKIAANSGSDSARIAMDKIEPGLGAAITPASLDAALARHHDTLCEAARETCRLAGITPDQVGTVILVGGSSLMGMVVAATRSVCPDARLQHSDPFTAVVDGLALASGATA